MRFASSTNMYKINIVSFILFWYLSIVLSKQKITITDSIPCSEIVNNSCVCKQTCIEPHNTENNTNSYCKLMSCWRLEDSRCKPTGKNYISALIFNIIPITQPFGIGYVILERWDLVGIQLAVTFGPFVLFCGGLCGYIMYEIKKKEDTDILDKDNLNTTVFTQIFQCCHSILLTTFWIMSIVDTSTPGAIKDGNGCYLSGFD